MNTYQQEQQSKALKAQENLDHIFNAINDPVTKLGYTINKAFYDTDRCSPSLVISMPSNRYFEVTIHAGFYNQEGKASVRFTDRFKIVKTGKPDSNGISISNTDTYEYCNYLSIQDDKNFELIKKDYRHQIHNWNYDFKALKNPKLILKDFLPLLEKYRKVVEHVTPKIDSTIDRENDTLRLLNTLQKLEGKTDYVHEKISNSRYDFSFGRVEVSNYGDITLIKAVSEQDLMQMIANEALIVKGKTL